MEEDQRLLERILDGAENPRDLPFELLKDITDGFSKERKIGQGGFGEVYKGVLGERIVAVKRIHINENTIDDRLFRREVASLMSINHRNVVQFLGVCSGGYQKLVDKDGSGEFIWANVLERLLCFRYISNGSLDRHITDELRGLEWEARYEIITGICKGLLYLHKEKNIIHMDLKPANILLDYQDDKYMVPKITDFGLSRPNKNSHSLGQRYGTLEYMAPEYREESKTTQSCDIYSLGLIIIELVTGCKDVPNKDNVLRRWRHRWQKQPTQLKYQQVTRCIDIAGQCRRKDPKDRPSIWEIINFLSLSESTYWQISPFLDKDDMLRINPLEVRLPFELKNEISCTIELTNETRNCIIAFNIEIPSTVYNAQPDKGIVRPESKYSVKITVKARDVGERDHADKFIVQSMKVEASEGLGDEDIIEGMFEKTGRFIDEVDLMVVYESMKPQENFKRSEDTNAPAEEVPETKNCEYSSGSSGKEEAASMLVQTDMVLTVRIEQGNELKQLRDLNILQGILNISGLENVPSMEEALEANLAAKKRLTKLKLEWDTSSTRCSPETEADILEGLCPPVGLKKLEIIGYKGSRYPDWMVGKQHGGPKDLQELDFSRCIEGPAPQIVEAFPHLCKLWLSGDSWDALPSNMKNLTSLKKLGISCNESIRSLPTLPQSLEVFHLIYCNRKFMKSCHTIGHPNWQKIEHIPNKTFDELPGVHDVKVDSQLHKVTVTGSVDAETLVQRLQKSGKQALHWENLHAAPAKDPEPAPAPQAPAPAPPAEDKKPAEEPVKESQAESAEKKPEQDAAASEKKPAEAEKETESAKKAEKEEAKPSDESKKHGGDSEVAEVKSVEPANEAAAADAKKEAGNDESEAKEKKQSKPKDVAAAEPVAAAAVDRSLPRHAHHGQEYSPYYAAPQPVMSYHMAQPKPSVSYYAPQPEQGYSMQQRPPQLPPGYSSAMMQPREAYSQQSQPMQQWSPSYLSLPYPHASLESYYQDYYSPPGTHAPPPPLQDSYRLFDDENPNSCSVM